MTEKTQLDKFKDAARELECDDDDQRFKERLAGLVRHRPAHASDQDASKRPDKRKNRASS